MEKKDLSFAELLVAEEGPYMDISTLHQAGELLKEFCRVICMSVYLQLEVRHQKGLIIEYDNMYYSQALQYGKRNHGYRS